MEVRKCDQSGFEFITGLGRNARLTHLEVSINDGSGIGSDVPNLAVR